MSPGWPGFPGHDTEEFMRPEITRTIDEIEQAIALLRRHL
jgi:hypothetical protein